MWATEIICQAILFAGLMFIMSYDGADIGPPLTIADVFFVIFAVLMAFGISYYLFTTFMARLLWRGESIWFDSAVAVILFEVHFEFLNLMVRDGLGDPHKRLIIRLAGCCFVFATTFVSSLTLGRTDRLAKLLDTPSSYT